MEENNTNNQNANNQNNQQWQYQGGTQGQYTGGPQGGQYQAGPQGQYGGPVYSQAPLNIDERNLPARFQPISMWGYFGYQFLFAIPIVGLILAIVWSFSSENINRRNYARSQFCWLIIYLVIFAICVAVAGSLGALLARPNY